MKTKFTLGQLRATKALQRFCRENNHTPFWQGKLSACVAALEARDEKTVSEIYKLMRRAGMGSFLDWFPQPAAIEDNDYAETLWRALNGHWAQQLSPFGDSHA